MDKKNETPDKINPSHYKQYPVETIDMMVRIWGRSRVRDYCLMNAFKYRMRLGHKDDIQTELKKEQWYLNKANELNPPVVEIKETESMIDLISKLPA